MARKYKKDITLKYHYANASESEQVLEQVFDKIFSQMIQKQKKLREYFSSDAFKEEYKKLSEEIFPDLKIGMLHGKQRPKEKERVMKQFNAGIIDILVSTSVVEVGVDVPNATVMMIEGADRFGLAQLHQFRGRVGRGEHQSYCLLFGDTADRQTNKRLEALVKCDDGFALAEKDLAIRGPGDFYGSRQWGLPELKVASLTDLPLIQTAREEAVKLLKNDHNLRNYPLLTQKLLAFKEKIHFE